MKQTLVEGTPRLSPDCRRCEEREVERRRDDPDADDDDACDWTYYPEHVSSIVVHHDSILRNKRVILTYMCARSPLLRSPVRVPYRVCAKCSRLLRGILT